MDIQNLQRAMEQLGKTNPLLAMLPAHLRGHLKTMEEYFAFGKTETDALMTYLNSLGVKSKGKRAVDFGCGLGRSTQALAEYFEEVYGIDIAPSMLQIAHAHNRHPERCQYILNETNNLHRFVDNSVDLILSMGVLYEMNPRLCKNYIVEFLRILAPGGVAVFQLPSVPVRTFKGFLFRLIPGKLLNKYRQSKYGIEVYPIKKAEVIELVEHSGGSILDIADDWRLGTNYVSYQYCIGKPKKYDTGSVECITTTMQRTPSVVAKDGVEA